MGEYQTNVLRLGTGQHFRDVASTFSDYWIEKRANDERPTRVLTSTDEFVIGLDKSKSYLPNDLGRLAISIHDKVMFRHRPRLRVEWDYVTCHNIRRKAQPPTLVELADEDHPYPTFHTNRITWWSSLRQDWATSKKVMWTRSGYTKPFYDDGTLGGTDMVYYIRVPDATAGITLAANMNTQLMQYIYKTAKWSGFGNERVFAGLPELPMNKVLSDQEMFELFSLNSEEAEYVRAALEPRRRKA